MKSSIYISTDKIDVIGFSGSGKKVRVKAYLTTPLPEGVMINGMITDSPLLSDTLSDLRKKRPSLFRKAVLVVDGSSVITRRMSIPKLSRKRCLRIISDEFSDTSEFLSEPVCDFHVLSKKRGEPLAVLACAVEKHQIESYTDTFKAAGIRLRAVRIGVQAILNYVNRIPLLRKSAFVLSIIDGLTALSVIFENGVNVFMSRTRIYGDDNEQLIQNILENLSGLIQFNQSEKFSDITSSYYLGLSEDAFDLMQEINPYSDIKLDSLKIYEKIKISKKVTLPKDLHFALLNAMLRKADSIDLIESVRTYKKEEKRRRPKKLWIPALAVLLILLAIPAVFLRYQTIEVNRANDLLRTYISDETRAEKAAELDALTALTAYYSGIKNQITAITSPEGGRIPVTSRVFDLIYNTNSETVTVGYVEFEENNASVRVNAVSAAETDSAAYIEELKKSALVRSVHYTGYSYNNNGEYNFSIEIRFSSGEGES